MNKIDNKRDGEEHTASGTRPALWIRADLTAWKKSTTPSVLSLSSWEWRQINVPVLPTPSLRKRERQVSIQSWQGEILESTHKAINYTATKLRDRKKY